jgi:hypothetical protein
MKRIFAGETHVIDYDGIRDRVKIMYDMTDDGMLHSMIDGYGRHYPYERDENGKAVECTGKYTVTVGLNMKAEGKIFFK